MSSLVKYPCCVDIRMIKADKTKIAEIKTSISFTISKNETEIKSNLFKRESLKIPIKNGGLKKICFCLMNPSKADEKNSDKTVNAIIELVNTKRESKEFKDVGELIIVNILPFYETSSSLLYTIINYFGEKQKKYLKDIMQKNQQEILKHFKASDLIVLGWGDRPEKLKAVNYDMEIKKILSKLYTIQQKSNIYIFESQNKNGVTKRMQPRHPNRLGCNTLKLTEVQIIKDNNDAKTKYEIEKKVDIL